MTDCLESSGSPRPLLGVGTHRKVASFKAPVCHVNSHYSIVFPSQSTNEIRDCRMLLVDCRF